MRINSVPFNTSFKSSNVLGYGDDISALRREGMRKRIEDRELYNVDFFLKEGRKSEFDEKQMIAELTKKPKHVSPSDVRGIAFNVGIYDKNTNVYTGSCLRGKPNALKTLKDAGVETVVSFVNYGNYNQDCKQAGLNYKFISSNPTDNFAFKNKSSYMNSWKMYMSQEEIEASADFLKREEKYFDEKSRKDVDNFVDFIQTVQKGNCYMGCESGMYRTNNMLLLEMLFNPQREDEFEDIDEVLHIAVTLYEKLTPEDKAKMGWTKEFDENFMPRIKEIDEYFNGSY